MKNSRILWDFKVRFALYPILSNSRMLKSAEEYYNKGIKIGGSSPRYIQQEMKILPIRKGRLNASKIPARNFSPYIL